MTTIFRRKRAGYAWETGSDEGDPDSGDVLPVAVPGVTVDDDTYDNSVTGVGKLRTVVLPAGGNVLLSVAVEGDAQPRLLINTDPNSNGDLQFLIGDGTVDIYNAGATFAFSEIHDGIAALQVFASLFKIFGELYLFGTPEADPHEAGVVWVDTSAGRVLKLSNG
jgi:hypothetical protein